MDEWETFIESVKSAREQLKKLSPYVVTILYHYRKSSSIGGFVGEQEDFAKLHALQDEGFILWDEGWEPDFEHLVVSRADKALDELQVVISHSTDKFPFQERFEEEFEEVRLSLDFTPFWEEVLGMSIQHSVR
ncbi:hypothetical protein GH741_11620 [Aquibacillus halophilus]|uniref:Uncharacterized protein n=1 Tax=Aquibacillus halophilus TaxID=930132 RepID=A0A6A8DK14_9BACI|nr:hypothetical protein [Aquibacillus halophilus]MRH43327.1 hypothetical protein [Aquibacillus halophilus]